jgi:hypothetical protein
MTSDALFRIRATRANPPGLARGERAATYGAALAQFDELMTAARASGPASRPLPLFYALSQAGRAIAAAHLTDPWRLEGHGLNAPDLAYEILDVPVRVDDRPSKNGNLKSFIGVAQATRSPVPVRLALGELWASLPEAFELLPERPEIVPLLVAPTVPSGKIYDPRRVQATVIGFADRPGDLQKHLEAYFPSTDGVRMEHADLPPERWPVGTPLGAGVGVWWLSSGGLMNHVERLEAVAPGQRSLEPRWLRPAVGGVALSPLMTWWMLLFGLSMLARYDPDVWVSALQYDSSSMAASLDQLLDLACDRAPELVLDALHDRPTAYLS